MVLPTERFQAVVFVNTGIILVNAGKEGVMFEGASAYHNFLINCKDNSKGVSFYDTIICQEI
ncbi:MAG: hypothetical protein ACTHJ5_07030 [Ilyomonas sp.]